MLSERDTHISKLNVLRDWVYNILKVKASVKGSFSDKQFKSLLEESFLDKIVSRALCTQTAAAGRPYGVQFWNRICSPVSMG